MDAAPSLAAAPVTPVAPVTAPPRGARGLAMLLPLLRPHRRLIIAALVLNALHGAAITYQTLNVKYVIDVLKAPDPHALRWWWLGGLVVAFLGVSIVGRMLMWHLGFRCFTRVRERVVHDLRARFFRHVNQLCLRFHVRTNSGELYSYLFGSPINEVLQFAQTATNHLGGALVTLATTLAVVATWDWPSAAVLYLTVGGYVLVMRAVRGRIKAMARDYQKFESQVSGRVADLLRGSRAVKVYGVEEAIAREFADEAAVIGRKGYELAVSRHIQHMKHEMVGYLAFALLMAVVAWRYLGGHIGEGEVAAVFAAFFALQGPVGTCFQAYTQWATAQVSLDRIAEVLETSSTTPDPADPVPAPARGAISLHQVRFAYAADLPPVIDDLSLTIPQGQRVALVGRSGAGKSTIAQLLLRLYDPDEGRVLIDGIDLRRCRGSDVRRRFGVVPQDPFVFRATLRENILVARGEADDAEVRRACERANAWEFVAASPRGLDTDVGEGGWTLSGGQRQRLAIARVLLGDPGFIILDEATSSLDTLSERLIQQTIEREFAGRTLVVIAHRLATVRRCDRILVIDRGRIVQDGPYARLAAEPGLFQDLVHGQELAPEA